MRIVSLLPAATEVLCDLGLSKNIVGISEECNFPIEIENKKVVSRVRLDLSDKTNIQIDEEISNLIQSGTSPYVIDEESIRALDPDFIILQDTCEVCAASKNDIKIINFGDKIIDFSPKTLVDIPEAILSLAKKLDISKKGEEIKKEFINELELISNKTNKIIDKPRVFAMEWIDPVYSAGHWVPEMIQFSGGTSINNNPGIKSEKLEFNKILEFAPNYMFIMPCGYNVEKTLNEIDILLNNKELNKIPAFNSGNVYVVDADSYFTRPGTRIIEGIKIMSRTISPANYEYDPLPDSIINLQNFIHFESFTG